MSDLSHGDFWRCDGASTYGRLSPLPEKPLLSHNSILWKVIWCITEVTDHAVKYNFLGSTFILPNIGQMETINTFQCARYCVEFGHKILISPISHRLGRDHQSGPMGLASQGRCGKVAISVAPPRIPSSTSGGPEATSGGPDSGTQTISRCYRPPLPVISGGPAISEAFNFNLLACATRPKSDPRPSHNIVHSQYVTNLFSAESRPRASLQLKGVRAGAGSEGRSFLKEGRPEIRRRRVVGPQPWGFLASPTCPSRRRG